ncbi:hypothetical protein ACDY96_17870 [Rhizobium mongolense]|uniref:hypothetical protein n=1 Tax=Rhizobium mongolense TaxID=57676 RepID=UPI0035561611
MSRIPRWAEKLFSARCSWDGAVASEPDEDINGWDYFIEFPDANIEGPVETTPSRRQAFVQVKSTERNGLEAKVKLSNMLKACSSTDAWFIVLVKRDGTIWGREIKDDLLRRSLKEIRSARLQGKQLNRQYLSIRFSAENKIQGNVITWMGEHLGPSIAAYAEEKSKQFRTAGYESGAGTGKFTVIADNDEIIGDNFLGLGKGLQLESFAYSHARFGLAEPLQEVGRSGTIYITPNPIGSCLIKVRGPSNEPSLVLEGNTYGFRPTQTPPADFRLRFSAPPLEVILSGQRGRAFLKTDENEAYALPRLELHAKLLRWMNHGPLEIEIQRKGFPQFRKRFQAGESDPSTVAFNDIVAALVEVARHAIPHDLKITIADIRKGLPTLHEAAMLLSKRLLRVEFTEDAVPRESFKSVMYNVAGQVGSWTLASVVERPVRDDRIEGGLRRLYLGHPSLREAYLLRDTSQVEIGSELSRVAEEAGHDTDILVIPEIMDRIAENHRSIDA